MRWRLVISLCVAWQTAVGSDGPSYQDFEASPHNYWQRALDDPFTRFKPDFESGKLALDRSGEKAFLLSLLQTLGIPSSSQMLVFSTTSLQLRLIRAHNPRALFFTDDIYLGYVPGGQIEIISVDPEVGGIFYLMDIPREERPLRIERSTRCMNCHASSEMGYVPGLTIKSSVPGPNGGTVTAFRSERVGHDVPIEERFGGWYVTGRHGITNHWGNLTGRLFEGVLTKIPLDPAKVFPAEKFPHAGSDILPQLIHEHQAGFVNRVLEAGYRARTALHASGGTLSLEQGRELDEQARVVTRYLLFADEAKLPGPVEGDPAFKVDFLRNRRPAANGASLKDLDLETRLFKHRCSYMIYSRVFNGLPPAMKQRIYRRLGEALSGHDPDYAWLPAPEKDAIRAILEETMPGVF